jgi:hypothetical protein
MRDTMKRLTLTLFAAVALTAFSGWWLSAQPARTEPTIEASSSRLAVLWTSGDPEVAHRACLMYSHAAQKQKWFDHVTLIVWGPSARLLAADKDVQAKVKSMMQDGVQVQACIACADSYGVSPRLRELGVEVKGMGPPLTDMLKQGWKVITF